MKFDNCFENVMYIFVNLKQFPYHVLCIFIMRPLTNLVPDHVQMTKVNCRLKVNCMSRYTKIFYNLT